ncbi:MAG: LacI family DNA-binding transcriptional regulator [Bacteroidota bacterium]
MEEATIHEIAQVLGLHSSTVSRALNDSNRVKPVTKERIRKTAAELGYRRNRMASNLRRKKSNTLGVIVPRISRHFFSTAIAGIEEVAFRGGYNVMICQSLEKQDREKQIIDNLMENRVDGLLISVSMQTMEGSHLAACAEKGIPLVFFDRRIADVACVGSVLIDDFQGGFKATEHLIKRGCKRIIHFTGASHLEIYRKRCAGYKAALEKHGIPFQGDFVVESGLMKEDGYRLMRERLGVLDGVDGIFSANDFAALGAMRCLKEAGKTVPNDLALVGFSNEPTSEVIEPSLTTLDQSGMEMGRLACDLLLDHIASGDQISVTKTLMLNPKLIERDSTQAPQEVK